MHTRNQQKAAQDNFKRVWICLQATEAPAPSPVKTTNATVRRIVVNWMAEVITCYRMRMDQTIARAITYYDRLLAVHPVIRPKLQLVAMAAMAIASKLEEVNPMLMDELVHAAIHTYTRQNVIDMERIMLNTLDFELMRPTIADFAGLLAGATQLSERQSLLAHYLAIEAASTDLARKRNPSQIAAGACYLALECSWPEEAQELCETDATQVASWAADIRDVWNTTPDSNECTCIRRMYNHLLHTK